jgi:hypothetical protein
MESKKMFAKRFPECRFPTSVFRCRALPGARNLRKGPGNTNMIATVEVVENELRLGPDPRRGEGVVGDAPDPMWVRGTCPCCGSALVSNLYYCADKGYRIRWECWQTLEDPSRCGYRLER